MKRPSRSSRSEFPRSHTGPLATRPQNNPFWCGRHRQIHELDQQHHVKKVFSLPAEVDRRSSVEWYQKNSGQAIVVIDPLRSTGLPDIVYRKFVYRITGDGAIEDQFAIDLQTGSSTPDGATEAFQVALVLPVPAILFAIGLFLVIANDPPQSYPAAVTALLKDYMAQFVDRGPCSGNRPGHPGPAEKSCVRPSPARANRLVGLCAPFRSAGLRGLSANTPLADPAAVSELPRSGSPRPCGIRGVRNALPGSFPERNRDLRLKRWWRTHGE